MGLNASLLYYGRYVRLGVRAVGVRKMFLSPPRWMRYPPVSWRNFWWRMENSTISCFPPCAYSVSKAEIYESVSLSLWIHLCFQSWNVYIVPVYSVSWVILSLPVLDSDRHHVTDLFLTLILFWFILRKLGLGTTYCSLEWLPFDVGWTPEMDLPSSQGVGSRR